MQAKDQGLSIQATFISPSFNRIEGEVKRLQQPYQPDLTLPDLTLAKCEHVVPQNIVFNVVWYFRSLW